MVKRYELTDEQWKKLEAIVPGKEEDRGRSAQDNRNFVNGVLWILRSGARWSDLPERYGKYKSVHKRFSRWAKTEIGEKVFRLLIKDKDNDYLMIDSTLVKAHQQASTYKKRPGFGAFSRRIKHENSYAV